MTLTDSGYDEIKRAWATAESSIRQENIDNVATWRYYGGDQAEYSESFRGLLPKNTTFDKLSDQIKNDAGRLHILEVAGEGQFIRSIEKADGGVAITLTDQRKLYMDPAHDEKRDIKIVTGEMLASSPWIKALNYCKEKIGSNMLFNLAVARPLAGWGLIPNEVNKKDYYSPELQHIVISRIWNLISPGASMFLEIPLQNSSYIADWKNKLKRFGVNMDHSLNTLYIDSGPKIQTIRIDKPLSNVPDKLPRPEIKSDQI